MVAINSLVSAAALASRFEHYGTRCDLSDATLTVPTNQTALASPNPTHPSFLGIAFGVQNYTCATTGLWTNVGAVAEVIDVSCAYDSSDFSSLATQMYNAWEGEDKSIFDVLIEMKGNPAVLGQHYFIAQANGTLNPKWDFTSASEAGDTEAYMTGFKAGDLKSPENSAIDIDWLEVVNVAGDLASTVYRVETVNGQPPTSCTPGAAEISVKYAAQYWFFGGNIA